jgi:hypothetical protein
MFQTKVVKKIKTYFMANIFFENYGIHELMWKKYSRAGRATDDNMARAHCILDT